MVIFRQCALCTYRSRGHIVSVPSQCARHENIQWLVLESWAHKGLDDCLFFQAFGCARFIFQNESDFRALCSIRVVLIPFGTSVQLLSESSHHARFAVGCGKPLRELRVARGLRGSARCMRQWGGLNDSNEWCCA